LDDPIQRQFLRPYSQAGWPVMTVVVRMAGAPGTFTGHIKKAIADVLPDRPVSGVQTMEEVVHDSTGSRRFPMLLLATFALVGLALAAVGIYGVVNYSVTQRTQEIGIRMALGAGPRDVLALVLRNGMTWVLAGVALGVLGSLGLTRLLGSLLFEVKPTDPFVLASVAALLSFIAALANYIPARRATKVDPMVALRYE